MKIYNMKLYINTYEIDKEPLAFPTRMYELDTDDEACITVIKELIKAANDKMDSEIRAFEERNKL
jgi:hypothetical protein